MLLASIEWLTQSINILWLILIVVTVAIELMTTDLTSIWFAAGALVALLLSLLGVQNPAIQIIVFLAVSIGLLLTVGRWAKKIIGKNTIPTNIDAVIGKEILIIKGASQFEYGEGKYQGLIWTISCRGTDSIEAGDTAVIVAVDGNKLVVERKK
ncbi:MAG: NfeD family protein [Bacilli bacterium]|jgi:membrane protein implicated in regulation of membrane protease activity